MGAGLNKDLSRRQSVTRTHSDEKTFPEISNETHTDYCCGSRVG